MSLTAGVEEGMLEGGLSALEHALQDQEEGLLSCVHCGFCLPVCPTYRRLGDEADSPRGRLYLMKAVVEGRLDPADDAFQIHIDRCLGCRACEPVCPSGVNYGHMLELARQVGREAKAPGIMTRSLLAVFARPTVTSLALTGGRLLRASGIPALLVRLLPSWGPLREARLGLAMLAASAPGGFAGASAAAKGRAFPGPTRPVEPDSAEPDSSAPAVAAVGAASRPGRVGVLTGCVQAGLFSRVNGATVRVLQANGYDVVEPEAQGCCGALHAHAGDLETARRLARRNILAFEDASVDRLAMNASGCGAAMASYGQLFEHEPEWAERAAALANKVDDVSELLVARGPRTGGSLPMTVAYDAPCHLIHAQGVTEAPLRALSAVPDLLVELLPRAEECCGGAGIYGLTHPELGGEIGSDKVAEVVASGAEALVTGNPGCMMQIGAGLRIRGSNTRVLHPVEILDESYRRGGLYPPPEES